MTRPIVYTHKYSPPGKTVVLTAKCIGLDVDFKYIDLLGGEQRKPEFLKINPQHTIPTLNDNGKILWDSHAIACYLISAYAKDDSLYPKDYYTRALIDQRLHFDSGNLFSRIRQCMTPVLFEGLSEYPEHGLLEITRAYDFIEEFLRDDPYLVGKTLTVADLACATSITSMDLILPIDFIKYPKIREWLDRLTAAIPDFKEIVLDSCEEFRPMFHKKYADNKLLAKKINK